MPRGGFEMSAKIKGADRFTDRLDDVYDHVVDRTQSELKAAVRTLHRAAERFAPVGDGPDAGDYRDSLRSKVNKRTATLYTRDPKAGVVEFGTTYVRNPDNRDSHTVNDWGSGTGLTSPPRVIYRALDNKADDVADEFFDALAEEFEAGGWLED